MQETTSGVWPRIADRLRWIAVRGLAAVATGIVVLGLGGRLVMFLSRLLHPDAVGRVTENGNRIGEFTADGTFALVIFGGLFAGLLAAVMWVGTKYWLPDKAWAVGLATAAVGGPTLVLADNRDFEILRSPAGDIVLLVGLVFGFGMALHRVDRAFDRRLPPRGSTAAAVLYGILTSVGVLCVPIAYGAFLTEAGCFCSDPNVWTGVGLIVATVASGVWWVLDITGSVDAPTWLRWTGLVGTWGAVAAGAYYLTREVTAILAG